MKHIEAVIRKERLDLVLQALDSIDITGITATEVSGHGKEKGYKDYYGRRFFGDRNLVQPKFIPKVKIEIYTDDKDVEPILKVIRSRAFTGHHGDGKIFVSSQIEKVIRIRTGETDKLAV